MIYAPIIIPTLSRYNHLERLIESLRNNSWANKTDVFVSVDFPPSIKYKEGYEKIIDYVHENFDEFHSFNVFYQEQNLSPYGNTNFLLNKLKEKGYDRYILLEDDNEASPNFIEYMDKGLEKFEKDEAIIGICGNDRVILSNQFESHGEGNYRLSRYMTYGWATWMKISDMLYEKCQNGYFLSMAYSFKLMFKLIKTDNALYRRYVIGLLYRNPVYYYKDTLYPIDTVFNIYMALFDKVVIVPNISKLRNYGYDGSGVGGIKDEELADGTHQNLDEDNNFDFDNHKPVMDTKEMYYVSNKISEGTKNTFFYILIGIMYCVLGKKAIKLKQYLERNSKRQ